MQPARQASSCARALPLPSLLSPLQALDEEQAEKQRKQQLAAMEEGEVATSPPLSARGTGAGAPPPAAGVRSPSFAQPYHSGGPGAPHGFGPLGPLGPKVPGEPGGGYGSGAAYGGGAAGGGFYGGRGPAAGPAGGGGELWEDSRTRDAWGTSGGAPGSTGSTPRGHREGLGPALGLGGGGTPLAGEREWERGGDFGWRAGGDYRGGPPGGGSAGRDRAWRGGFDDRRCGLLGGCRLEAGALAGCAPVWVAHKQAAR